MLYYACLFIHVDLEAAKQGIGGVEDEDMPSLADVLKSGWHFLVPIFFLVIALIYPEVLLLTPEKAAVAATAHPDRVRADLRLSRQARRRSSRSRWR